MSPMNDASVRDRAKNLARKTGVSPQAILQMHLLERLLARIAKSAYADKVVLNGRARDFYDAVLMLRLYADTLGWKQLGDAIRATASRRGSESALATWRKRWSACTHPRTYRRRYGLPMLRRIHMPPASRLTTP